MASLSAPPPPPLQNGDALSRAEFEHRYSAMPHLKKAELIDGVVYIPGPVRFAHGAAHASLGTLLNIYAHKLPGLEVGTNCSVRLDLLNEVQPDLLMVRAGGKTVLDPDGIMRGAPEFVAEISITSDSRDLHQKKRSYLRSGVLEYLVWIVDERRIVLWQLLGDEFVEVEPSSEGLLTSPNFPGLVIDVPSLIAGDLATALTRLS